MTTKIEREKTILEQIAEGELEYADEDYGLPRCRYCFKVQYPGITDEDNLKHSDDCISVLAKTLLENINREITKLIIKKISEPSSTPVASIGTL